MATAFESLRRVVLSLGSELPHIPLDEDAAQRWILRFAEALVHRLFSCCCAMINPFVRLLLAMLASSRALTLTTTLSFRTSWSEFASIFTSIQVRPGIGLFLTR